MNKSTFLGFTLLWGAVAIAGISRMHAQVASAADALTAQPATHRTVPFKLSDEGVSKPIIWGFDLAWRDENNMLRGIAFSDAKLVGIVRSSFTPTAPIVDGQLGAQETEQLNYRINALRMVDPEHTQIMLNCDNPTNDEWFYPLDPDLLERTPFIADPEIRKIRAQRWAELIDITIQAHENAGFKVVSVAPFNEPDYIYNLQCTQPLFNDLVLELMENPRFDDIRISAGNTLNCDPAWEWYNYMKQNSRADEGNTHQLAGYFPQYADFFTKVRANGDHATNDELHNVMEAMVGVEYGMQTGIWWGSAEYCRGEFMKASEGKRLAYAEHRDHWTSASVYRHPQGHVQAFVGASERQATTTSYRFVSQEKDVYYDGHGPQREFVVDLPGGDGYGVNQPSGERVVNITWGDDIQPVINGRYVVVNRHSKRVMDVENNSTSQGAKIQQKSYTRQVSQRWDVTPVDSRIGGDFSYFHLINANSGLSLDVLNFSLEDGTDIIQYGDGTGNNQQFYLDYAEDGWFYIRSRLNAKCLEVSGVTAGSTIVQRTLTGAHNQQWRFLPVGVSVEMNPPSAPTELIATAQPHSIRLDWTASPESDLASYTIFRAESPGGPYTTLARDVTVTSFVDNKTVVGITYYYAVKAIDQSLNRSEYSNETSATPTGGNALLMYLPFEGDTKDQTINLNHSALYGEATYTERRAGSQALSLNGTDNFLQLPAMLPHAEALTVSAWVNWKGGRNWQRIFDFGNSETEHLFLTTRGDVARTCFTLQKDGKETQLLAPRLPLGVWSHIAVTMGPSGVQIYIDGEEAAESAEFTVNPLEFKPIFNYIGRSQSTGDPMFFGDIDDFRVYNYALSASEIAVLAKGFPDAVTEVESQEDAWRLWPLPARDVLHIEYSAPGDPEKSELSVFDTEGRLCMQRSIRSNTELDVSGLSEGLYVLQIRTGSSSVIRKFHIRR